MAGHVRRRPSGSWQAIASYRDPAGRLIQLTATADTKAAANRLLPDLLAQAQKRSRPAAPGTLNDLLDLWWEVQEPKLSPSTAHIHGLIIAKHIRPKLGAVKLSKLTGYELDRLYLSLQPSLGPHAINNIHRVLSSALSQAVKWKWLPDNPAADATPPKIPRTRKTLLTQEDFDRLLEAADAEAQWFGIYLRLSVVAPGRRGELTALRWGDFSAPDMTIDFSKALVIGRAGVSVKSPKTVASYRTLIIGPQMTKLLTDYRDALDLASLGTVPPVGPDDYLFTMDPWRLRPLNPATVSRTFARVRGRCGLTIRLHDMRTLSSSWLQHGGISLPTASHRLGHSRTSTTSDLYTRRVTSEDQAAANLLDQIVTRYLEKGEDAP